VTRVVAGVAGGRRLAVPSGRGTRPTSERAREGLFSTLEALRGLLAGARVLDLYAGSGAVGLEAASRGAGHVLLVESEAAALRVLRANVAGLALPGVEVAPVRVERLVAAPNSAAPYDVVFADPPYALADAEIDAMLRVLPRNRWLADDGLAVVERASRGGAFRWPEGYLPDRSRRYGEGTLWYGRAAPR